MYWNIGNKDGHTILYPSPDADFSSIILGMAIRPDPKTGALCYAMCARRRGGGKLWQMDYEDEAVCDAEIECMRIAIAERHADFDTMARRLTQFNEETGAISREADLSIIRQMTVDAEALSSAPQFSSQPLSIRDHVLQSAQEGVA